MGLDRNVELQHLNKADAHIADAERRVSKQKALIEELRKNKRDVNEGERLLRGFQTTLDAMRAHRDEIVKVLAKIDAGLI